MMDRDESVSVGGKKGVGATLYRARDGEISGDLLALLLKVCEAGDDMIDRGVSTPPLFMRTIWRRAGRYEKSA